MEIIKVSYKPTIEEKETHLYYNPIDDEWVMDSNISKHFRKAVKQGWIPIRQYVYADGTVSSMMLRAPERAITIRNTAKKQMSEKQLNNLCKDSED